MNVYCMLGKHACSLCGGGQQLASTPQACSAQQVMTLDGRVRIHCPGVRARSWPAEVTTSAQQPVHSWRGRDGCAMAARDA